MMTGTGKAVQSLRQDITDTTAAVTMTLVEAILNHNIGIITITTGVAHSTPIPCTGVL